MNAVLGGGVLQNLALITILVKLIWSHVNGVSSAELMVSLLSIVFFLSRFPLFDLSFFSEPNFRRVFLSQANLLSFGSIFLSLFSIILI